MKFEVEDFRKQYQGSGFVHPESGYGYVTNDYLQTSSYNENPVRSSYWVSQLEKVAKEEANVENENAISYVRSVFNDIIPHAKFQKDIVKYVALLENGKCLDGPGYRNEYVAIGLDMLRVEATIRNSRTTAAAST